MEDDDLSVQSDVYAFACVCMEILHQKQPHASLSTIAKVLNAIYEGRPPYEFSDTRPIPKHFETIFTECWSPDPMDRPTMQDVYSRMISEPL